MAGLKISIGTLIFMQFGRLLNLLVNCYTIFGEKRRGKFFFFLKHTNLITTARM